MTYSEESYTRLDQYIDNNMKAFNIPAVAVGVTNRKEQIYESSHGFSDVAAGTPLSPKMLFEIGSIGKSFTSIAILQLVEEGLVDLHEPITRYLPWFSVDTDYEPITIHHLLSHTAGIIAGPDFPGDPHYEVWSLRNTQVAVQPGIFFHYSNSGYKTLGVLLEDLLGLPYGEIVQMRILDPLGMTSTKPIVTNETRDRLVVGYEAYYDDRPLSLERTLAPATWLEHAEGAGSIASTATDMSIYLRMLLNRGMGPHGRILSEDSFDLMTTPVIDSAGEGKDSFYGYGLVIREVDGHTCFYHGGGMVGYYAFIYLDMKSGLGSVVLMNAPGGQADEEIIKYALSLARTDENQEALPEVPLIDQYRVENTKDYVGTFQIASHHDREGNPRSFVLKSKEDRLIFSYKGELIELQKRGQDCFYVNHPDFELFLLRFGREDGQIVEAFHGPHWYINDKYEGPTSFHHPESWEYFIGHYCAHNPWYSKIRVILRKGTLVLVHPSGEEDMLVEFEDGLFRVGKDERLPEQIRFDAVINRKAYRADLSGVEFCRTFTP